MEDKISGIVQYYLHNCGSSRNMMGKIDTKILSSPKIFTHIFQGFEALVPLTSRIHRFHIFYIFIYITKESRKTYWSIEIMDRLKTRIVDFEFQFSSLHLLT